MSKTAISMSSRSRRRASAPRRWLPSLSLLALVAAAAAGRASADTLTFTNYKTGNGLITDIVTQVYAHGSYIYALHGRLYTEGVSYSPDGGATWIPKTSADGVEGFALGIAGTGSTVYVGTTGGLAVSTNNGATWTNNTSANGLPGNAFGAIALTPGPMYLVGGVGVNWGSGSTWTSSGTAQGLGGSVFDLYVAGSNVYAGTNKGLSVSTDGGPTWNNTPFDPPPPFVTDIIWGVWGDGSTVYGATASQGLAVSTNNGSSYSLLTTAQGLVSNDLRGVTVSGSSIYVSAIGGLSISSDGGATWQNYTTANGLADDAVFDAYVDGNTLYVATAGGLSVATLASSAVPEIDPAGMGSVVALLSGALGLLERRRRTPVVATRAGQ